MTGKEKILKLLEEGGHTLAEIAKATGLKKGTVKLQLKYHLPKEGYVIEEVDEKFQLKEEAGE